MISPVVKLTIPRRWHSSRSPGRRSRRFQESFFWCALGDFLGIVPQRVELGGDRLHGWEFRVGVAVLADQLPTHLGSIKPRVQAVGAEVRISLALRINNGRNIAEEIGQMCFRWLAPARGEVVQADQAAFQFTAAFPNRLTIRLYLDLWYTPPPHEWRR